MAALSVLLSSFDLVKIWVILIGRKAKKTRLWTD